MKKTGYAILVFLALSGCTTTGNEEASLFSCHTLACIQDSRVKQVARQCRQDLFFHERQSRFTQEVINNKYRYPLTNWNSYAAWTMSGNAAPSPDEWCKDYAEQLNWR